MDTEDARYLVRGGRRLAGRVTVSGAKNSALKLMAACLLAPGAGSLHNVPDIQDVRTMREVLEHLGARVQTKGNDMVIDAGSVASTTAPYELVQRMRASIQIMGPLVARFGRARVAMPGGCNLGPRKIDFHLRGLSQLGAKVSQEHGFVEVVAERLRGAAVSLDYPSVGATENLMMASVLADGVTVIDNAAREPEIVDLSKFLVSMGAEIEGAGTSTVTVRGVKEMYAAEHTVMCDRIEAGTFLIAAAVSGGDLEVHGVGPAQPGDLPLEVARDRGPGAGEQPLDPRVGGSSYYSGTDIATLPYPGFATDLQAQTMVLLSLAQGKSMVTENVFENRFVFVDELVRLGAEIKVAGHHAVVTGGRALTGATVRCSDLRAGAALVLAGLVAEGVTEVRDIFHIDRGYENFEQKLRSLGADLERVDN